jgi:hypothetical protein
MALSQNMIRWVSDRVREAEAILADPRSTPGQCTVARYVLAQWRIM